MKVLFLNPNWSFVHAKSLPGCKRPHHPLELLYPATMLAPNNQVLVIDAFLERLSNEDLIMRIQSYDPDVIVMSTAPSYLFWRCCPLDISLPKRICNIIKSNSRANLIIIGPHPTISPKWVLEECQSDYLIRGEPEISITNFINSNLSNKQINGLYSYDVDNGVALVDDMDLLPKIDFSLSPSGDYHSHLHKFRKGASVEFSRGCIYQCSFCFKQQFRNKYRVRPIEKVVGEIEELKGFGYRYIYFIDELFNYDSTNLRELLNELRVMEIAWGCQCRPDAMTSELIRLMKYSGCCNIEYGIESLCPEVSKSLKTGMNHRRSLNCINFTARLGIKVTIFFLYGAPSETLYSSIKIADILNSLDKRISLSSALLIPYPTTPLFQQLTGKKDLIGKDDWVRCSSMVGNISELSRNDLEKIIIISHIINHLRNWPLSKALANCLINMVEFMPAIFYSYFLEILLTIRKQWDIQ